MLVGIVNARQAVDSAEVVAALFGCLAGLIVQVARVHCELDCKLGREQNVFGHDGAQELLEGRQRRVEVDVKLLRGKRDHAHIDRNRKPCKKGEHPGPRPQAVAPKPRRGSLA